MLLLLIPAICIIAVVLIDAFETMVLPRRTSGRLKLSRTFYRLTWGPTRRVAGLFQSESPKELFLGFYGPLSLLIVLGIWAGTLIVSFALAHYAFGSAVDDARGGASFQTLLFFSGETFFTLGLGDVVPTDTAARVLTVLEAGTGFVFLALVVGYLPVLYQSFARREARISLLDARASSPPSSGELFRRTADDEDMQRFLEDWEAWAADLLESHLSYPVLGAFRSHHDRQSWVAALTVLLDTCALLLSTDSERLQPQAQRTFAIARHAAVDLAQVYGVEPVANCIRHLTLGDDGLEWFRASGRRSLDRARLLELRELYEPYCEALASYFAVSLPDWRPAPGQVDAWETTARET